MPTTLSQIPATTSSTAAPPPSRLWPIPHLLLILAFWLAIFAASLRTPPLLDDADATHAQAAQSMLATGDLVTLHVNGIRYLEKAPLPYWIAALSLRLFGPTAFAIHLPLALTVLALALLGYTWSRRAFSNRAALYTALFLLTSTGTFLFTRIFIPDALLSLLLALALYHFLRALEPPTTPPSTNPGAPSSPMASSSVRLGPQTLHAHLLWLFLALAVLTKGLVALVFFFGAATLFLLLTSQTHLLHRLRPKTGLLLFLAVAAPWHILAGLRNAHAANGQGFFWFYFINEHVLRFLGRRIPRDYNKLPTALFWSLHLLWLFPWSLFTPAALLIAWRKRRELQSRRDLSPTGERLSRLELFARRKAQKNNLSSRPEAAGRGGETRGFSYDTVLLLTLFSALVLAFFSLSTNQEYYTFPAYLPLLILLAAALANIADHHPDPTLHNLLTLTYATLALLGLTLAATLAYSLYTSRNLPYLHDIGAVLAHRNVAGYTLSLSHFFDLTGPSFAALRLPATLAAIAFTLGPAMAFALHARRRPFAAILTVATTSAAFLIAAHLALVRFTPMLSSQSFAATIQTLQSTHQIEPDTQILLYGDQSFGSSIPFYLDQHVLLVDGSTTSMAFGSTFPDAPPLFLTPTDLAAQWAHGPRKLLFVPLDQRPTVDHLLGPQLLILQETSGKLLLTDRPLDHPHSLETGIWHLETDSPKPPRQQP